LLTFPKVPDFGATNLSAFDPARNIEPSRRGDIDVLAEEYGIAAVEAISTFAVVEVCRPCRPAGWRSAEAERALP